jgi:peptidyl-prolyl cis-trans isomerase D
VFKKFQTEKNRFLFYNMALIQQIRDRRALIVTLMVLAIAGFIFMLLTQDSNRSLGSYSNTTSVASVGGKSLEINDLESRAQVLYGERASDNNVRNALFSLFVEDVLIDKEAKSLGLGVSKDELLDLEFGQNVSQVIITNPALADPNTGVVDMRQLAKIKEAIVQNTMPADGKRYWSEIEKQVVKNRLQEKLTDMVSKAVYVPSWLVDEEYKNLTQPVDFQFVRIPYDRIDDKDAQITDADYNAYLKENAARFTAEEETRTLEYINFDVVPTSEDSANIYSRIATLKSGFRAAVKDSAFVLSNNGSFPDRFATKEELGVVKDSLFGAAIGTVVGPYIDGGAYVMAKVIDRRSSPDSVKSRHILIQGAGALQTADSLKAILEGNIGMWDSLNMQYSGDQAAKMKGGDLGFAGQGMFVPQFNDLLFYKAQQGKLYTVATQFGAHIIQVTGVKAGKNETRVKVAFLREPILPSDGTSRNASVAANGLLSMSKSLEDLKKNAQAKGFNVQPTPSFKANDASLGQFGSASGVRQLVRWAFEAKQGGRAKEVFAMQEQGAGYVSRYVVAALKQITPKGTPTLAAIKEQLTPFVKNKKKGDVLVARIGNNTDLATLSQQFNTTIDTASGVTYNATFVPKLGSEPKLMGSIFSKPEVGRTSAAIAGETAAFVARITNKQVIENGPVDKNALRQQLGAPAKQQVRGYLMRSLRKNSEVTDNRAKFF